MIPMLLIKQTFKKGSSENGLRKRGIWGGSGGGGERKSKSLLTLTLQLSYSHKLYDGVQGVRVNGVKFICKQQLLPPTKSRFHLQFWEV